MAPSGYAILLGAGPTTGAGIARILASPSHGNLAVALLSRTGSEDLANDLAETSEGGILKAFKTDTSRASLDKAFEEIKAWASELPSDDPDGEKVKPKLAIYNIKHSHKTPIADETTEQFSQSLETYVTGALNFAQLSTALFLTTHPSPTTKETPLLKRGTLIFTGTLGSLRTNAGFAAYGAGRAGVRMLAQSLARELSEKGIHVVHAIANGGITDKYHDWHGESEGRKGGKGKGQGKGKGLDAERVLRGEVMRGESVGKLYLHLMEQECDLWCHELDMRPAAEKF